MAEIPTDERETATSSITDSPVYTLTPMMRDEEDELERCEAVIEEGLAAFIRTGEALATIRDKRLYRQTHGTFEAYCADRWKMSRPRSYQLMSAAEMSTIVDIQNEGQARALQPLAKYGDDVLRAIWGEIESDFYGHDEPNYE